MSKIAEDWYMRGRSLQDKEDHTRAAETFARATAILTTRGDVLSKASNSPRLKEEGGEERRG